MSDRTYHMRLFVIVATNGRKEIVALVVDTSERNARFRFAGKWDGWIIETVKLVQEPTAFLYHRGRRAPR